MKGRLKFLGLGILIGFLATFAALNLPKTLRSREKTAREVVDTYQLANPGSNLKLMDVKETSGLYRIVISTGPRSHRTVYATKDGKLLTESVLNLEKFEQQMQRREGFFDCLKEKDVEIYGALQVNSSQIVRATQLQIQILGGAKGVDEIYNDCSGNLKACARKGVTKLPAVKYEGRVYPGIKSYSWLSNRTGCTLG